jgi:hypothetical protein
MRKYVACLLVAAAAVLIGIPALAGAQARQSNHANQGKQSFIVIGRHRARVTLFIQRSRRRTNARVASCPAGQLTAAYCTPPVEQTLFGAYAWNDGGVTFGSNSSSTCKALGYSASATSCGVYTTVANELIAAFVGSDGPSGAGQSMTVSCTTASGGRCPVTFHKVNSENAGGGDSEVWYADATSVISQTAPIFVTAKAASPDCGSSGKGGCDVSLQAVTFENAITAGATGVQATGIGASSACYSKNAAPSCSVTTTEPGSMVWAEANDPKAATIPTWPSSQFAIGVADSANQRTFYTQFTGTCRANANGSKPCTTMALPSSGLYQNPFTVAPTNIPTSGTAVTINDTAPATQPFNMVDVEIL